MRGVVEPTDSLVYNIYPFPIVSRTKFEFFIPQTFCFLVIIVYTFLIIMHYAHNLTVHYYLYFANSDDYVTDACLRNPLVYPEYHRNVWAVLVLKV